MDQSVVYYMYVCIFHIQSVSKFDQLSSERLKAGVRRAWNEGREREKEARCGTLEFQRKSRSAREKRKRLSVLRRNTPDNKTVERLTHFSIVSAEPMVRASAKRSCRSQTSARGTGVRTRTHIRTVLIDGSAASSSLTLVTQKRH